MLRKVLLMLVPLSLPLLGGCKAEITYQTSGDETLITCKGEVDLRSSEAADKTAKPLGSGTLELEDGQTFKGEVFDTDGDGKPDKFKPDPGQEAGNEEAGLSFETNGEDWFDLEVQ